MNLHLKNIGDVIMGLREELAKTEMYFTAVEIPNPTAISWLKETVHNYEGYLYYSEYIAANKQGILVQKTTGTQTWLYRHDLTNFVVIITL